MWNIFFNGDANSSSDFPVRSMPLYFLAIFFTTNSCLFNALLVLPLMLQFYGAYEDLINITLKTQEQTVIRVLDQFHPRGTALFAQQEKSDP